MKVLIALEGIPNQGPDIWSDILFKELFKQFDNDHNQVQQVNTTKLKQLISTIFHIKEFDIFHFYSQSPGAALLFLLFKILGKKTVFTVHGNFFIEAKYKRWPINLLWIPAHLFVIKNVTAVTFPSKYLHLQIKEYFETKKITKIINLHVIPNGIHIDKYPQELNTKKSRKLQEIKKGQTFLRILSVTSFIFESKTCGVDLLMEVNKELSMNGIKTEIRIGGVGPELELYKKKYKLKNVKFLNYCDNYNENLLADIFIHLTFLDNLPTVILNAAAIGLPTIASQIGGIPEIFNFYSNKPIWGLTQNDKNFIVDKILELISNEDFYLNVSRQQYENVKKNFNIQIISNKFWQLYIDLKQEK